MPIALGMFSADGEYIDFNEQVMLDRSVEVQQ